MSGRITFNDAGRDIVAAATWLKNQSFIDATRISTVGWSYGGGAVLAALTEHREDQLSFSRAVVYYPVCQYLRPWKTATPVLMLLAGADDVAPGDTCEEVVRKSAAPSAVQIVLYSGAQHGFDILELPTKPRYLYGTLAYDAQAAAAAQDKIDQFLDDGARREH
jgi:dienelactone hydrolase